MLSSLADTIEKQAQLNKTIRSAMTYPAVVLGVMVVIFSAMIIFIVPVFQNLFKSLGRQAAAPDPDPHRHLEHHDQRLGPRGHRRDRRRDHRRPEVDRHREGRRIWDRWMLKPPIFGQLFHKVALARVTNTLASLISSGVPILESLDICAETAGNVTVGDVLLEAKNGVREGRPLADPLREHEDVIPTLVVQMIEVGEQTGALDGMLKKVGEFYDQEVEVTVNNLTALLEPLLTVVMGCMVGAMVICLYLPMFDYIKLVPNAPAEFPRVDGGPAAPGRS